MTDIILAVNKKLKSGKYVDDSWRTALPRDLNVPLMKAHATIQGRGGPLLTPEQWTEISSCLQTIVDDTIVDPPNRNCVIVSVAKIIKLLELEEV